MGYNLYDDRNPGITQDVCPVGWYLPTDSEWIELTDFLGGESVAGGKLKEVGTNHWESPNTGATNESGFTALSGGSRLDFGDFFIMGLDASFWSSTESSSYYAWFRSLDCHSSDVNRSYNLKEGGFSVRCLRDSCQYSYLTISNENFRTVSDLNFYGDYISEEIILINSSAGKTIDISSIYTKNAVFGLNKSSSNLSPGDSIHLTITFDPTVKNIYRDTLFIESDDPYDSLITILLNGTFPPELSFTDSTNISCFGYTDGTATVTPSLGTPPYQYQWDDPGNNADSTVTGLEANIYYHVTVTDSLEWTVTDSIMLSEPDRLEINTSYSDTICLYSNDGFISTDPSGGTSPYDYIWSTGAVTQAITGLEAGDYSVKLTDSHGCVDSADFTIHPAVPYDSEQICIVTVDLLTGKNLIIWEKTPSKGIAYYKLYRENTLMDSVDYDDLSIFLDTVADPEKRPYLYRISIVDTCGNESAQSLYHKPLFLQYTSSEQGVNLTWSKYEIEGEVINFSSYTIYRGSDSTVLSPLEEDIPKEVDIYTDNDPNAMTRKYFYRVAGNLTDPCYPIGTGGKKAESGPYSHSMSNIKDNRFQKTPEGITSLSKSRFRIIPNPFNETTTLMFHNPEGQSYTLYIMDLTGKVCRIVENINTSEYVLKRGGLKDGFYFLELRGPELLRGKMVIE